MRRAERVSQVVHEDDELFVCFARSVGGAAIELSDLGELLFYRRELGGIVDAAQDHVMAHRDRSTELVDVVGDFAWRTHEADDPAGVLTGIDLFELGERLLQIVTAAALPNARVTDLEPHAELR